MYCSEKIEYIFACIIIHNNHIMDEIMKECGLEPIPSSDDHKEWHEYYMMVRKKSKRILLLKNYIMKKLQMLKKLQHLSDDEKYNKIAEEFKLENIPKIPDNLGHDYVETYNIIADYCLKIYDIALNIMKLANHVGDIAIKLYETKKKKPEPMVIEI